VRQSRGLAWGLATAVGLAAGLAGYVAHSALTNHTPKQDVRVQRLTDRVGLEESPALSPNGKSVAFVAARQIWVLPVGGGVPVAITSDDADHDADHGGPRWSADSGSLIYYSSGGIWEIPAAGGSARRLVDALGPGDFSHVGKSLAFFRIRDGVVELVAGGRVVTKLKAGEYSNLRWSPDDTRIAYLEDSMNLMVARLSTGELVRAATGNVRIQGFAWAPDGSGLIVSSAQGSVLAHPPTYGLWFIPRVGDTPSQLTFGESSYQSPDAGPQGNVVVSRVRSQSDIWKLPVTGDPAENARRGVRITHQTGQVQDVAVSPDESEVAFLSDSGGRASRWIARVSDGEMRPLVSASDWANSGHDSSSGEWKKLIDFGARNVVIAGRVAWSRDGEFVYAAVEDVDSDIVLLSGLRWR
jgi:Tol biopolymer transport system component